MKKKFRLFDPSSFDVFQKVAISLALVFEVKLRLFLDSFKDAQVVGSTFNLLFGLGYLLLSYSFLKAKGFNIFASL